MLLISKVRHIKGGSQPSPCGHDRRVLVWVAVRVGPKEEGQIHPLGEIRRGAQEWLGFSGIASPLLTLGRDKEANNMWMAPAKHRVLIPGRTSVFSSDRSPPHTVLDSKLNSWSPTLT